MKEDIFDRIMHFYGLRVFNPFYKKHKEVLLYLFWGGCSFVLNIFSYSVATIIFGISELLANVLAWILAVVFAFFTNRIWVFQSKTDSYAKFARQMADFFCGRIATLVVEEVIILIFIAWMKMPGIPVKIVAQIVVILLNYIISKLWGVKE